VRQKQCTFREPQKKLRSLGEAATTTTTRSAKSERSVGKKKSAEDKKQDEKLNREKNPDGTGQTQRRPLKGVGHRGGSRSSGGLTLRLGLRMKVYGAVSLCVSVCVSSGHCWGHSHTDTHTHKGGQKNFFFALHSISIFFFFWSVSFEKFKVASALSLFHSA